MADCEIDASIANLKIADKVSLQEVCNKVYERLSQGDERRSNELKRAVQDKFGLVSKSLDLLLGNLLVWHEYAHKNPETEIAFTNAAVRELFRAVMPAHARIFSAEESKEYKELLRELDSDRDAIAERIGAESLHTEEVMRQLTYIGEFSVAARDRLDRL